MAQQLVLGAPESETLRKHEVPGTGNFVGQGSLKLRFPPEIEQPPADIWLGKYSASNWDKDLVELLRWDTFL